MNAGRAVAITTRARLGRLALTGALVLAFGLLLGVGARAETTAATCTKTWTGTSGTGWTGVNNWSPSGAPGASDYVCITSGTNQPSIATATAVSVAGLRLDTMTLTLNGTSSLTVTDATATKSSELTGGTIAGAGTFTVGAGHVATWEATAFSGTGATVIAATATVNLNIGVSNYAHIDQRAFTNNGTIVYTPNSVSGYALYLNGLTCTSATTLTNNGTFTYVGNNTLDNGILACGTATIANNGTFTKTAGTLNPPIGPAFNNAGTVSVQAGTLTLQGGSGSGTGAFGATGGGALVLGSGTFNLGTGSTFTGGVEVNGATVNMLAAGTLTMTGTNTFTNGAFDGPGAVTVNGTLVWTGGAMQGAGSTTIGASGTVVGTVGSNNYLYVDQRAFTNNGTFAYTPNSASGYSLYLGGITCTSPTTFTNNGTFTYAGNATLDQGIISCGTTLIHNTGSFTKTTGSLSSVVSPAFDNDGTVSATAGELAFTGGGGTGETAVGQFGASGGGNMALRAGDFHVGAGAAFTGEAAIDGGSVFVDAAVPVTNLAFSAGRIDGAGTLTVNGALTWTGGRFVGSGSTVIAAAATVTAPVGATDYLVVDARSFVNNGTFTLTSNGASGYTLYLGGDTCTGTTTFTNNGTFTYNGNNTVDNGIISCSTATIINNGTFTKATGTLQANVNPDFDNNGTIAVLAGKLSMQAAFPAYDAGTQTLLKGTYNLTTTLQFPNADVIHNQASVTLNTSAANLQNTGSTNGLANFNDNKAAGSFTVTGGKSLAVKPLTNAGSVTVGASSTLSMNNGPFTQTGGTATVNGTLTSTGAGAAITINGGTLQGSGTVSPSATSSGIVRPGTSPGILSVGGAYTQNAAGSLAIEIGGPTAGTDYDRLQVSGAATLNGTLTLSTINAFSPTIGQTFTVLTYPSHTGCFTTINGRDLAAVGAGMFYDVSCGATSATVTVKRAELSVSDATLGEGDAGTTNMTFTVSLNQARPDLPISVGYSTSPGTATAPADYTTSSGTVSWLAGDGTAKTFTVPIVGDLLDEIDETFSVALASPTNSFILDGAGTGTIVDNDPPPSASINDVALTEGNSGTKSFGFTISLNAPSGKTVTVNWATANGTATAPSDYAAASGTATFNPGVTTQPVSVTVNGDTTDENNETFNVNLSLGTNVTIGDSQGVGTINNDDTPPTISINDVTLNEGNSGTTSFGFTVSLSAASGKTVTVNWATANGTAIAPADYATASGTATFNPGVTTQPVSVTVVGETLDEINETFNVNLSAPTNATISDGQGVGTITNDDTPPSVSIGDVTQNEGNSGTTSFGFTATLSAPSGKTVTVQWQTADGTATAPSDYAASAGTLTFAPGITSQPALVSVNGDVLNEADETFNVNLTIPTNVTIADGQGVGTITNDDGLPSLSINDITVGEGNSGTTSFQFTVTLSAPSASGVSANWATADGTATQPSDYPSASGTVNFAPGVTTQPVSVNVNGDFTVEPNETFFVNLSSPVNASISDGQGQGTIANDDFAPTVTGFNPPSAAIGKIVTVLGTHFTGTTQVAFTKAGGGTVNGSNIVVVNDGQLTVKVPALATTGPVAVTTPSGTGTSTINLKIKATVKSFTPTSGPVGTLVTINGSGFTGTTKVTFNGTTATGYTVVSDTKITVTVPAGATTGKINVTNPGGVGKSKTDFTVTL